MRIDPQLVHGTCMGTRARMAARAISRIYDEVMRPLDLKNTQFAVLVAAYASNGQYTISEVADMLGLDRTSLSRNLAPLERRGLIKIGPETRHRARHIGLTEAGHTLLQQAMPLWAAVQEKIKNNLGTDAWDSTITSLGRLAALD